ncbi:hypothetical protein SNE40_011758 [Patella caerulea]
MTMFFWYTGESYKSKTMYLPNNFTSSLNVQVSAEVLINNEAKPSHSMTLTIRTTSNPGFLKFLFCTLLRTVSIYWSKHLGNVAIILDEESVHNQQLENTLKAYQEKMGINFDFYHESLPKDARVLKAFPKAPAGYNRQLYSSFIMDTFIKTPVIAWTDTDSKFITPVTMENIFNGNKLRVKGMDSSVYHDWFQSWDTTTRRMIGKPMMSDFMTYFPVYIWRDTITNCRNYILKYMNVTDIEQAYIVASSGVFLSPVNVIMSYAYYFEREKYDWHLDIFSTNLPEYNKLHLAAGHELNPSHLTPDLHVTLHDKYYKDPKQNINIRAYCSAIRNTTDSSDSNIKSKCQEYKDTVMWPLYEFETRRNHLNSWCKGNNLECVSLINKHYDCVRKLIKDGIYLLDLGNVKAVETAAFAQNITCKPFL